MESSSLPNEITTTRTTAADTTTTSAAINTVPESPLSQLTESLQLEYQLLRVPFQHYLIKIRSNRCMAMNVISSAISSVAKVTDSPDLSKEKAVADLNDLVSRLQVLKHKLEEGSRAQELRAHWCRVRLEHVELVDNDNVSEWNDIRVNRILVDYILRMSYYDTVVKLTKSSNIQDLVDINVFQEAKQVIEGLRDKNIAAALDWCADNKAALKKYKSNFEFQLRAQEFVELIRADKDKYALEYAQKFLAPWGENHMKELQRVMPLLALKSTTQHADYKVLFDPKRWDALVDQFKEEFRSIYCMTSKPLLNIYLQAGLSALKTPYCSKGNCSKEDPLSQERFGKLALELPYFKRNQTKRVCLITKKLIGDTLNPHQVLPNGHAYSLKALIKMAYENDGKITCPRTGSVYNYSDVLLSGCTIPIFDPDPGVLEDPP